MKPVIIGAGLAGLTAALSLAPRPVILLSSRALGDATSSAWAQGGVAAAVADDDQTSFHADDTLKAGAGLCDPTVVTQIANEGPAIIEWLSQKGVVFDRDSTGWRLGLEGGHSHRRILHAEGDSTGLAIMKALIAAVHATPSIEIIEGTRAVEFCVGDKGIAGIVIERALENDVERSVIATNQVILATGGAGALWQHTTNPLGSWGGGLVLAARAGAVLGDLEFMQFHPTAIDIGRDPMPLASEALRGEGAVLVDEMGQRFMAGQGRAELEPRDIVARAIWNHMAKGHKVFLDARKALGKNFAKNFPFIYALCISAGIDAATQPIPVRPAAHYHMGGVLTDLRGRSSVNGLWVAGEVACTGLHGANRLASNSLLEAVFSGRRVAEDISGLAVTAVDPVSPEAFSGAHRTRITQIAQQVRAIMSKHVGVLRDEDGLQTAVDQLTPLVAQTDMALAGLLIATSALQRKESRGAHTRTDFTVSSAMAQRRTITLDNVLEQSRPSHSTWRARASL